MNVWTYNILIKQQEMFPKDIIYTILKLAAVYGYSPFTPREKMVHVIGGNEEIETEYLDDAVTFLSLEGGLLELWQEGSQPESVAIDIVFSHRGIHKISPLELNPPDKPVFGEISIGVESVYYNHRVEIKTEDVATEAQNLFGDLCTYLESPYGYSHDEYALEQLINDMVIHDAIYNKELPKTLFWLQYISNEYAGHIDTNLFKKLGAKFHKLPKGFLVSFFDNPWDVDVLELELLNKKWKQVRSSS